MAADSENTDVKTETSTATMGVENVPTERTTYDESYTVSQLREVAKQKGIIGYSSMSKVSLIEKLNAE